MRQRINTQPNTNPRVIVPSPIIVIPRLNIQFLSIKPMRRIVLPGLCMLRIQTFTEGAVEEVLVHVAAGVGVLFLGSCFGIKQH